jgi:hypothetical protein
MQNQGEIHLFGPERSVMISNKFQQSNRQKHTCFNWLRWLGAANNSWGPMARHGTLRIDRGHFPPFKLLGGFDFLHPFGKRTTKDTEIRV